MTVPQNSRFHHAAMSVRDMDRSLKFYCDLIGFEVEWEFDHVKSELVDAIVGLKDVDVRMAMLAGYGARLELFQYYNPAGEECAPKRQCDFGLTHICLFVDDVQSIYDRLVEQGVEFISPPQNHRPGGWVAYMRDPDGTVIEILHRED